MILLCPVFFYFYSDLLFPLLPLSCYTQFGFYSQRFFLMIIVLFSLVLRVHRSQTGVALQTLLQSLCTQFQCLLLFSHWSTAHPSECHLDVLEFCCFQFCLRCWDASLPAFSLFLLSCNLRVCGDTSSVNMVLLSAFLVLLFF